MMVPMQQLRFILVGFAALVSAFSASAQEVVRLRVEDTIQPASQQYIERVIREAGERHAELVVLELDTPGGLVDSTRDIMSAITGSAVPVAVLVTPAGARAASAGFFILVSADIAAMSPGTNTGAAHPVLMPSVPISIDEKTAETLTEKATNDATAMIRAMMESRGRNVDLAVEVVTESKSFTASEAMENDLIDLIAGSTEDLISKLDGKEVKRFDGSTQVLSLDGAHVETVNQSFDEHLKSVLAMPIVALALMAVAALGIYTEVTHPGGIAPGIIGATALLLFIYSSTVLPVNGLGILLILIGIGLFALEVKFVSYGLLTVGGLACFVAGALILFDTPIPDLRLNLAAVIPTALVVAATVIFLLQRVVNAHRRQVMTGAAGLVGEIGRAISDLDPDGKVLVHGEYWDARSQSGRLGKGAAVRVEVVGDKRIDVSAAEPVATSSEGSS